MSDIQKVYRKVSGYDFMATPTRGQSPLPVQFNATKSIGTWQSVYTSTITVNKEY